LKRVFSNNVEGLITENVVDEEVAVVEGVITLMSQSSEQLIEDLSIMSCESSGIGLIGNGQKFPMPPTIGKWNRSDPNTILRVLCHRNKRATNVFLKKNIPISKEKLKTFKMKEIKLKGRESELAMHFLFMIPTFYSLLLFWEGVGCIFF